MHVADIISDVVSKIQVNGVPYYEYGHPLEIIDTLRAKSESKTLKYQKYPLIALFMDIPEKRGNTLIEKEAEITVLFITDTLPTYKAAERLNLTFKPILIPLFEQFCFHLKRNKHVHVDNRVLDIQKYTEHMFWGKEGLYGTDGNIFEDRIDAIEVKINLKIYNHGC